MTALSDYLDACRRTHANPHTTERSYYSALEALFDACSDDAISAHGELALAGGDRPDLGIYESGAPVLLVEVKLPDVPADALLRLEQARRYADALGGWVLATNLNDFVLGRVVEGELAEVRRVRLCDGDPFAEPPPRPTADAERRLRDLLAAGCAERRAIREPSEVARLLAAHARALVDALPHGGLESVRKGFRDWLKADLDDEFLVPTTVQAIVYGMFATWLESDDPGAFEWRDTPGELSVDVIAEIVHAALPPAVVREGSVKLLLEGVAGVLRRVERNALAEAFDDRAIEYFYEPFLAEFDSALRDTLGVWYTPPEIAAYQVARADHHLKTDLGISAGLADDSVIVLDPAAGTGTYLAAVYDYLHGAFMKQGHSPSEAAQLLREAARTRLVGFEILPAALLISDLHLRRLLRRHNVPLASGERPAVYLTNSLSGWFDADDPNQMALPGATARKEVETANRYKRDERVLVVLGNPPWQGYSSAESADEEQLVHPWTNPLTSEWGVKKHRLNDLYVRFWAAAALRITRFTGTGVVSFISNRKWLAGKSYPAMRADLLAGFDRIAVDDLGGDSRGAGGGSGDESVFKTATAPGVQVGVAIVTAVRLPEGAGHDNDPASTSITHRIVAGSATGKRARLSGFRKDRIDDGMAPWETSRRARWKLGGEIGTDDWPGIDEYFRWQNSGVQPVRDPAVTDYDQDALRGRMDDYFTPDIPWDELVAEHPAFGVELSGYNGGAVREKLLKRYGERGLRGHEPLRLVRCLWRPLDARWLYWEPEHRLLNRPRPQLIPYWNVPGQVALVSTVTRSREGAARPLVSTVVPTFSAMAPSARALPLRSPDGPNVAEDWIRAARNAGVPGDDDAVAEAVFHALCGVAASDAWLASQPVEYDDFPTVPLPADAATLAAAAETGRRYAALVDPCVEVDGVTRGTLRESLRGIAEADACDADPVLEYGTANSLGGRTAGDDLLWGPTGGWRNMGGTASGAFTLGGYNPIRKHLSYFVGERLMFDDRRRVTAMARRIAALRELAREADAHFHAASAAPLELR